MLTAETITDEQIHEVWSRALDDGDRNLRWECDIALGRHPLLRSPEARRYARAVIAAAHWALGLS